MFPPALAPSDSKMLAWVRPAASHPQERISLTVDTSSSSSSSSSSESNHSPEDPPAPPTPGLKTASFFSSPFTAPEPPQPPHSRKNSNKTHVSEKHDLLTPSATASFFSSAESEPRPTPPPSLAASRSHSPARLPPLARFFPSRYTATPQSDRDHHEPRRLTSHKPTTPEAVVATAPGWETSFKREFIHLSVEHGVEQRARSPVESIPVPPQSAPPRLSQRREHDAAPQLTPGQTLVATDSEAQLTLEWPLGQGAFSSVWLAKLMLDETSRVVAAKMMPRGANDRTRLAFQREAEVLRHLSHPNIVSSLAAFTTESYHTLALAHIVGGELFDLVNSDARWADLTAPAVRRIWGELAGAVGWLHSVGVVHRDIKLENILLTTSTISPLPDPSTPLTKLTDFGLARFIDPDAPRLRTRCGSEAYAAPELVVRGSVFRRSSQRSQRTQHTTSSQHAREGNASRWSIGSSAGGSSLQHHGSLKVDGGQDGEEEMVDADGTYDGRETDAWACGVVLYALATRALPFDTPHHDDDAGRHIPDTDNAERGFAKGVGAGAGMRKVRGAETRRGGNSRRDMLMRIAQCEYTWPPSSSSFTTSSTTTNADDNDNGEDEEIATPDLKAVVARLLVRNPGRRARMDEVWDEPWMRGVGAPPVPEHVPRGFALKDPSANASEVPGGNGEGVLVDGEHVARIAREEVDAP
ncbi:kinase-like protein [Rickenella mellea]|uniref:Kinase-like protein n=1 Tax=Rickenella mellea TaxID=50990 RepID=A0A4Y7PZR6_9AGAM|nr:kinase-like protein [Rickenella mellea]